MENTSECGGIDFILSRKASAAAAGLAAACHYRSRVGGRGTRFWRSSSSSTRQFLGVDLNTTIDVQHRVALSTGPSDLPFHLPACNGPAPRPGCPCLFCISDDFPSVKSLRRSCPSFPVRPGGVLFLRSCAEWPTYPGVGQLNLAWCCVNTASQFVQTVKW